MQGRTCNDDPIATVHKRGIIVDGSYSRIRLVDHLTINGGHIPIDCGASFDFIHSSAFQNYERENWKTQKQNILESFMRKRKDITNK